MAGQQGVHIFFVVGAKSKFSRQLVLSAGLLLLLLRARGAGRLLVGGSGLGLLLLCRFLVGGSGLGLLLCLAGRLLVGGSGLGLLLLCRLLVGGSGLGLLLCLAGRLL